MRNFFKVLVVCFGLGFVSDSASSMDWLCNLFEGYRPVKASIQRIAEDGKNVNVYVKVDNPKQVFDWSEPGAIDVLIFPLMGVISVAYYWVFEPLMSFASHVLGWNRN